MKNRFSFLLSALKYSLVAAIVTAVASLFLPNYYRSDARILPLEAKGLAGGLGGLASAAATLGLSVPGADGNDANFVDVLQSRWMAERILGTEFTFKKRTWLFGAEREITTTLYDSLHEKNIDRALKEFGKVLVINKDLKSKVITISAETKNPALSKAIVQETTNLLELFVREKGRTRGGAKAAFAAARLVEARQEMGQAEDELRRFMEQNRNAAVSTDPQVRLKGLRLEAELKLRQQLVLTLAMNREQALLEEKNDVPIINILDMANLPVEKSRPSRSILVLGVAFAVYIGLAGWANRDLLRSVLQAD
ncbi:MAG: hypothetical protein P4L36_05655 [Holophaga sp.]|nr:hypothetical protein [Holophaga sp.]